MRIVLNLAGHLPAQLRSGDIDQATPQSSDESAHTSTSTMAYSDSAKMRQHIFVAATLPNLTRADVGKYIERKFKDVKWLHGVGLHQSNPRLSHSWHMVTESGWMDAVDDTIKHDPDYMHGNANILIFTKDMATADEASRFLSKAGLPNVVYHKNVPEERRVAALRAVSCPGNCILISTDSAARGTDMPNVTHVIQAHFASTAIDFLHRIGRTARAGSRGTVTSLYQPEVETLVRAVRACVEARLPLDGCFSRNRSFARKLKKYGKFVPRGEAIDPTDKRARHNQMALNA